MLFALWIVAMMPAARGITAATDPFAEARRQIDTGRAFEEQADFEGALAAYRRASEALSDEQPIGGTLLAPHKVFGLRPEAAVLASSVHLDEIRMLNFLGRRNSDRYTLELADAKLSALTLLADKTNLFGTCDNPTGPAGAWHAQFAFFETPPLPGHKLAAYLSLGRVELLQDHLALARVCFEKAQTIDRTNAEARESIADIDRNLEAARKQPGQPCTWCLTQAQKYWVDAGLTVGVALLSARYGKGVPIAASALGLINHLLPERPSEVPRAP